MNFTQIGIPYKDWCVFPYCFSSVGGTTDLSVLFVLPSKDKLLDVEFEDKNPILETLKSDLQSLSYLLVSTYSFLLQ